jgi:hypothetical protein
MESCSNRWKQIVEVWKQAKMVCSSRKVKNGPIGVWNESGWFRWKWLEMALTQVNMFKRVETDRGGMKRVALGGKAQNHTKGQKWANGCSKWKRLETGPTHGIMFKRVETNRGGMKMASDENGQKWCPHGRSKMNRWVFRTKMADFDGNG